MSDVNLKKVAAYCRVSTENQKEKETIETQFPPIKEWVADNNAVIIEWYLDDGWSGELLARPALDKLRDDATKNLWDAVIFVDRDRLARKLSLQELVIDELRDKRKEIIFLNEPLADNPEGRIMQQIKGVFAEYERAKITERMRRGKLAKAKKHELVGHRAPYGYKYIPVTTDRNGYFEINESEAEIVRMVFHWVADEGYSFHRVVRKLYELKIPPPKNKKPYWAKSSIARMLNRTDYIGTSYYNRSESIVPKNPIKVEKYKRIKKSSRKARPKDDWFDINVPRIIDDDLFYRAKQRMKENFLYGKRNKHYPYLLTGKVFCLCGIRRVGDGVNGHHYYRCAHGVYKFPLESKCEYGGVNAEILDTMVWNKLLELMSNPQLIKSQVEKWNTKKSKTVNTSHEEIARLKRALETLSEEEKRYTRAFATKLIDFEQYKMEMKEVKAKKESIESKIKDYDEKAPSDAVNLDSFEDVCDTIYHSLKYTEDKQEYIRNLIVSIYVGERRKALVNGRIPLLSQAQNIQYEPISRNRRFTQRWQVNVV